LASELELALPVLAHELLEEAARRLRRAGVASPRQEAMALWAAATGITLGRALGERDREVAGELASRFQTVVARRAAGEPHAYAAGLAGFRTLDLLVDRRVLIPRPETEGLVDRVLNWSARGRGKGEGGTVLDLGTGSGCIALSLAVEGDFGWIVATDVSDAALDVARANLARLRPPLPSLDFRLGSLFQPVEGESFDVVVSNPPYVTEAEFAALDRSVRDCEPREALVSGADGLAHTRAILDAAGGYLKPGGLLALEVDSRRAGAVADHARARGWVAWVEQDVFGRPRYLFAGKERG
jgi:release factor glutamine methyltransferase